MRISSKAMRSRVISSSAANGSSISSTAGSSARARASDTRCCMPPDSWCGYLVSNPVRPTTRISSSILAPSRGAPRPAARSRSRPMLLATLSQGIRFACWNTRPMRPAWRKLRGATPPIVTIPRVGAIRSATTLSKVLLPQPDGPTSETNAPSGISSVIPESALTGSGPPTPYVTSTPPMAIPAAAEAVSRASSAAAFTSVLHFLDCVRQRLGLIEALDDRVGVHLLRSRLLDQIARFRRKDIDRGLPLRVVHQPEALRIVGRIVKSVDDLKLLRLQLEIAIRRNLHDLGDRRFLVACCPDQAFQRGAHKALHQIRIRFQELLARVDHGAVERAAVVLQRHHVGGEAAHVERQGLPEVIAEHGVDLACRK